MNDHPSFLTVESVSRCYPDGDVAALSGISFQAEPGEIIALMGPSGCGKSTLLSIIGALDRPTSGRVLVNGVSVSDIPAQHLFRAKTIGFVFQFHHLVPTMTLAENVESAMIPLGVPWQERKRQAQLLLDEVGLEHRASFLPSRVSGGERQRAAVARALANTPALLLADEPTGNLDSANGLRVFDLLLYSARQRGTTVIIATHNRELALRADRILPMNDGLIFP